MSVSSPYSRYDGNVLERGRSTPYGVVATAHFESGPPSSKIMLSPEDGEILETVREEAWEERRKKTTTTTKNVERRVQRKLILEDGEVVGDTGPVITVDKLEDSVTKEEVSDENQRPVGQLEAIEPPPGEGWVATPGALVISEKCTKTTNSHEEVEDEIETEEIQHCGDVTNQEAEDHVKGRSDLRELIVNRQSRGWELAKPQKRVVHEATRRKGNIDTVDVKETSKIQDGHVVTETERTVRQEQYDNESAPDSGSSMSDGSVHEATKETSHNLIHTKDEDILEYYAVPRGGTLAQGVKLGEGMHVVSEDVQEDRQGNEGDPINEKLKKVRRPGRRDALTKRPLDYNQEEETRKCETNRWLEHHFGSESGRSESSDASERHNHSSGGNRITITMSPRPATPEDTVDAAAPSPIRQWREVPQASSTPKAPPPPPPPKPGRVWSPANSPSPPPNQNSLHEIQDTHLAAARARLRSTGRSLTEENKENSAPTTITTDIPSSHRFQTASRLGPTSTSSLKVFPAAIKNDVVYSSRFRSGNPKRDAPLTPESPPPLPSTPPPSTNVGRSQSFHVSTLPWSSKKKDNSTSLFMSKSKDYKSEEHLDDIDRKRENYRVLSSSKTILHPSSVEYTSPSLWQNNSWKTKSNWSPPREPTPPPPPRQSRRSPPRKTIIESFVGREASTQTLPSPVPPPRTKRKKRPQSSYFFGQESDSPSYSSLTNNVNGRHKERERTFSDNSYSSDLRYPKEERWYKTTKIITPVLTSSNEKYSNNRDQYHSSNKSSWTNTVDPRRRPRVETEEFRTLPRKVSNNVSGFPKKTYIFGESDSSNKSGNERLTNNYKGSMQNISVTHNDSLNETNRYTSITDRFHNRMGKPVGRSHSFNVQPGQNISNGRPLGEISSQKSASAYRSSPYLNLRSPNLISTIARTSSVNLSNSNENAEKAEEDKRNRFMKGLLTTAPELYHFIHGNENNPEGKDSSQNQNKRESPPSLNRPSNTTYVPLTSAKSPTYTARVFTFGKGDNNTLTRTSSLGLSEPENGANGSYNHTSKEEHRELNKRNSSYVSNNNKINAYDSSTLDNNNRNSIANNNRKSTFNMKASGSSLLYSPSFRNENEDRRNSRASSGGGRDINRLSGEFGMKSNHQEGSPVLIPVREWNMR